jgi:hypothetical protein
MRSDAAKSIQYKSSLAVVLLTALQPRHNKDCTSACRSITIPPRSCMRKQKDLGILPEGYQYIPASASYA